MNMSPFRAAFARDSRADDAVAGIAVIGAAENAASASAIPSRCRTAPAGAIGGRSVRSSACRLRRDGNSRRWQQIAEIDNRRAARVVALVDVRVGGYHWSRR